MALASTIAALGRAADLELVSDAYVPSPQVQLDSLEVNVTNSNRVVTVFLVAAAWACVAAAADPSLPGLGSRVRVTSIAMGSGYLVGTLTGIEEKSLAVRAMGQSEAVVLPRQEIRRLEWRRPGRKKKGTLIGLGLGFAAGFGGTMLLGDCTGCGGWSLIYGSLGAGLGAVTGALVAPGEGWAKVPLDRIHYGGGLEQQRRRFQLSVIPTIGPQRGLSIVASFP